MTQHKDASEVLLRIATGDQSWEGLDSKDTFEKVDPTLGYPILSIWIKRGSQDTSSNSSGDSDHQTPIIRIQDTIQEKD